jgi:hypothetical protein
LRCATAESLLLSRELNSGFTPLDSRSPTRSIALRYRRIICQIFCSQICCSNADRRSIDASFDLDCILPDLEVNRPRDSQPRLPDPPPPPPKPLGGSHQLAGPILGLLRTLCARLHLSPVGPPVSVLTTPREHRWQTTSRPYGMLPPPIAGWGVPTGDLLPRAGNR